MIRVLIIGDSISICYTPHAAEALGGGYELVHNEGNASHSANLLARLDEYLTAAGEVDIVVVNCGLHDLRRDDAGMAVPLEDYKQNLQRIMDRLAQTPARLIWVRTTPIDDVRHAATHEGFGRRQADVDACNAVADAIMADRGVTVADLHAAVIDGGIKTFIRDDGVHMTDHGYLMLGKAIADVVRSSST